MPLSEQAIANKKRYSKEYAKNHYKRFPLDFPIAKYEEIQAAAEKAGESVTAYIKNAVDTRMKSENQ